MPTLCRYDKAQIYTHPQGVADAGVAQIGPGTLLPRQGRNQLATYLAYLPIRRTLPRQGRNQLATYLAYLPTALTLPPFATEAA